MDGSQLVMWKSKWRSNWLVSKNELSHHLPSKFHFLTPEPSPEPLLKKPRSFGRWWTFCHGDGTTWTCRPGTSGGTSGFGVRAGSRRSLGHSRRCQLSCGTFAWSYSKAFHYSLELLELWPLRNSIIINPLFNPLSILPLIHYHSWVSVLIWDRL